MTRKTTAIIFLIISAISSQLYLVGNHGELIISTFETEDWIFCGVAISAFLTGIYIVIGESPKTKRVF